MRRGSILSRREKGATKPYLTYPYFQEAVTAVAAGEVKASEEGKYPVKKEGGSYPTMKTRAKPTIPLAHPEVNTKQSQYLTSPQNDYFDPLIEVKISKNFQLFFAKKLICSKK